MNLSGTMHPSIHISLSVKTGATTLCEHRSSSESTVLAVLKLYKGILNHKWSIGSNIV